MQTPIKFHFYSFKFFLTLSVVFIAKDFYYNDKNVQFVRVSLFYFEMIPSVKQYCLCIIILRYQLINEMFK